MHERTWTASNILSLSRLALTALAGYCLAEEFPDNRLVAAGLLAVAILTDFLDGYVARRLHQVSELGKIIDPLADKIAVAGMAIVLVLLEDIPLWFVVAVLVRDTLILIGGISIRKKKNIIVQSNWPGKIAVSAVALYLWLSVLKIESLEGFRDATLWTSVVLMVLSLAIYSRRLLIGRAVDGQGDHGTL